MKSSPSDPDNPCLVYGFPANPPQLAPEAPLVLKDRPPNPERAATTAVLLQICLILPRPAHISSRGFVDGVNSYSGRSWRRGSPPSSTACISFRSMSHTAHTHDFSCPACPCLPSASRRLAVSPSSLQLNGTRHVNFSMVYKYRDSTGSYFPFDGAAVSVYYKGVYLAGPDLHTFRVPREHPLPLEVSVDASRRDVPAWLARDLAEVGRVVVMELEVQFLAKYGRERDYYLCGNLTLGFSTADEANLSGDGLVRCPFIA